jgi:archaellum component FlaC
MPASKKKNMKPSIYITKADLHDYVTKYEFNEFASEMRDFRENTTERFDQVDARLSGIDSRLNSMDKRFTAIDKRFDSIDRRIDSLEEQYRVQTGVILQEMRTLSKATMEYLRHLDSKITTLENKMS